jgi:hypothetical protein
MNTKRITLFFSVLLFAQSGFAKRNATTEIFPLQQLTGNTNAMLRDKYRNVDTADFQKLESSSVLGRSDSKKTVKRESNIQKKRSKYPKTKINNIDEARKWMSTVYGIGFYYYKQVDDGFLIKRQVSFLQITRNFVKKHHGICI